MSKIREGIKRMFEDKLDTSELYNDYWHRYINDDKLYKYLADNGYQFVKGIYKDANHNRQSYQLIFYNGENYCNYYRIGNDPDAKEQVKFSHSEPRMYISSIQKISSYDSIHNSDDEPWKFAGFVDRMKKAGMDVNLNTEKPEVVIEGEDILLGKGWRKNIINPKKNNVKYYPPNRTYPELVRQSYIEVKELLDGRLKFEVCVNGYILNDAECSSLEEALYEFDENYNPMINRRKENSW